MQKTKRCELLKNQFYLWTLLGYLAMIVSFTIIWMNKWNLGQLYGHQNNSKILLLTGFVMIVIAAINFTILKHKFSKGRWIIITILTLTGTLFINGILGLAFGLFSTLLIVLYGFLIQFQLKKSQIKKVNTNE